MIFSPIKVENLTFNSGNSRTDYSPTTVGFFPDFFFTERHPSPFFFWPRILFFLDFSIFWDFSIFQKSQNNSKWYSNVISCRSHGSSSLTTHVHLVCLMVICQCSISFIWIPTETLFLATTCKRLKLGTVRSKLVIKVTLSNTKISKIVPKKEDTGWLALASPNVKNDNREEITFDVGSHVHFHASLPFLTPILRYSFIFQITINHTIRVSPTSLTSNTIPTSQPTFTTSSRIL